MKQYQTTTRAIAAPASALALAFTLFAASSGAMAEVVDVRWDSGGRYTQTVSVAAGKFIEVCDKLTAGARVRWSFESSITLDFNIHYHVGKEVVFPSKLSAVATAQDTLHASIEQDYCWTWRNKPAMAATITLSLQRR